MNPMHPMRETTPGASGAPEASRVADTPNQLRPARMAALAWWRAITPAHLLVAAMAVMAGSSVLGAFRGLWLIPLAAVGALTALVTVPMARRLRLQAAEWLAVAIGLFMLMGGPIVGLIPSPGSYAEFFRGLINGWADLLSSVPPVELAGEFRVVPYALAWLAAVVGFGLLHHVRLPGLAGVGPLACFGLGLLFTVEDRQVALVQGGVLIALGLALGLVQQRELGLDGDESMGNTTIARKRARLLGAGAILVAIAAVSPVLTAVIPGLDSRERFDLRDKLEPPWSPLNEASPLARIKGNYPDEVRDEVAFVAEGPVIPDRWALATLAHFDGTVWTVGDSNLNGAAPFVPIDRDAPIDPHRPLAPPELIEVTVELGRLDSPWLPVPGRMASVELATASNVTGEVVADRAGTLRFNPPTGTLAIPEAATDVRYTVEARPWPVLTPSQLEAASVVPLAVEGLEGQAGVIRSRSADLLEGVEQGWPQVEAIRQQLRENGFYLADERVRPGHSWARLGEFFGDEEWYGNEEQYAAVAAIIARNAGMSARVVVGYDLDDSRPHQGVVEVLRHEASAWIEVLTVEYGWIPVDVTPDRDKEPSLTDPGVRIQSVAAPNPPPPPPPPPQVEAETPDEEDDEDEDEDEEEPVEDDGNGLMLMGAGAAAAPIGFSGLWLAAVGGAKAARRRRRRSSDEPSRRVAGAWYEAGDRLAESGRKANRKLSVNEQAREMAPTLIPSAGLETLAMTVDRAAFDNEPPNDGDVAQAWAACGSLQEALKQEASRWRRLVRLAHPGPLLRKDPK